MKAGLQAKGSDVGVDDILAMDSDHRKLITELNELRTIRNQTSEDIAAAKRSGDDANAAIARMRQVADAIRDLEARSSDLELRLQKILLTVPNLPHESVPDGRNAGDNVIIREWGTPRDFDFTPKDHLELGDKLGLFNFKQGAKIAGSGFPLYRDRGARLERALLNFMLDLHTREYGFTEIFPPFAAREDAMEATGQLPKFVEDMYHIGSDDLYLIPTAEVPVTNIHRDEILSQEDLPVRYAAYSACFRREAGSYGKETRGFLRLHQFNKVELVKFVEPESSYDELESLTRQAEAVLQALGLRYRVVSLCSGDLSFSAAKCYDLEVWAPGEKAWLEVSSCSNFEDFQARRGNIRYRRTEDKKVEFVHTLNGSGVATPRLLVALLETYQTEEGTIQIPKPLQPYFGAEMIS